MRWRRFAIAASAGASFTPYGTSVSWAVSGRYGNGGWQAEAGAAQSMRLPTFTDLYYTSEAQVNNPNLKPERAVTYHIGGGYAIEKWHASVQFFYRDGRNVIDWVWRDELTIGDRTLYDKWHSGKSRIWVHSASRHRADIVPTKEQCVARQSLTGI